jgi:hypothetical protein
MIAASSEFMTYEMPKYHQSLYKDQVYHYYGPICGHNQLDRYTPWLMNRIEPVTGL